MRGLKLIVIIFTNCKAKRFFGYGLYLALRSRPKLSLLLLGGTARFSLDYPNVSFSPLDGALEVRFYRGLTL